MELIDNDIGRYVLFGQYIVSKQELKLRGGEYDVASYDFVKLPTGCIYLASIEMSILGLAKGYKTP